MVSDHSFSNGKVEAGVLDATKSNSLQVDNNISKESRPPRRFSPRLINTPSNHTIQGQIVSWNSYVENGLSLPVSNVFENDNALNDSSLERKFSPPLNPIPEGKIIPENSFLEKGLTTPVSNIPQRKIVSEDCFTERSFTPPVNNVAEGMTISEESSERKQFIKQQKDVHKINTTSEVATLPRRFSPRLKNITQTERPHYGGSRRNIRCHQVEGNGNERKKVNCNSFQTNHPGVHSGIAANIDSELHPPNREQGGLQERSSRQNRSISKWSDFEISNPVISSTSTVGCTGFGVNEAGRWLNSNADQHSAYERVKETVRTFNTFCQQFSQILQEEENAGNRLEDTAKESVIGVKRKREDACEDHVKASQQPDLMALFKMFETKSVMYPLKRFGHLPGIDVGYQFHSRAEMAVLGFHADWLYGIDYMGRSYRRIEEYKDLTFPLAVAIVLSGEQEENQTYSDDVFYTCHGRNSFLGNQQQVSHGNIALKNNLEQSIPVRLARQHICDINFHNKVYAYDGLYEVVECCIRKGISGVLDYRYRLRRLEGQPKLTINEVSLTTEHKVDIPSTLTGLVCMDISNGQEEICIPAFNFVDDTPFASTGFMYSKYIQVAENMSLPANAEGCRCKGNCKNPKTCACARLNGSKFPYVRHGGGRLLKAKDVVFECGPNCGCGPDCINRISQQQIRYHLEVIRTQNRGWAVRTRDFIPSGAPVCEYVGVLKRTDEADKDAENDFIFEIDCLHTIKGVDGREKRLGNVSGSIRTDLEKLDDGILQSTPEFCIDAGTIGNVARFINHSCQPNLFVQCVLSAHRDMRLARIVLFASDNIKPLQEITYDYGYALDSVVGSDGKIKEMPCYCGTTNCRKRLY